MDAGIIYPPPDLRVIVDKTAGFIAKNGPEFELRVRNQQRGNPQFNFLRPNDPYHAYFLHKCCEQRERLHLPPQQDTNEHNEQVENKSDEHEDLQEDKKDNEGEDEKFEISLDKEEPLEIPNDPPEDYEFSVDPPTSLTNCNLEVMKLTAQFVAMNGREFLTNLLDREQNNVQFDFLRPQHGHFEYFSQLIEQYSKIIHVNKQEIVQELKKSSTDRKFVFDKMRVRAEFKHRDNEQRQRIREEEERLALQYAQIDWHDFVVVETIDYAPNERVSSYPPPTTPDQVGSRALIEQRLIAEEKNVPTDMDMELSDDDDDNESSMQKNDLEEKLSGDKFVAPALKQQIDSNDKDRFLIPTSVASSSGGELKIKKDYDPKQKAKKQATKQADAYFISPITNERVPADQLQHHVHHALIDPEWIEQKDRQIQAKINQEDVLASGAQMESSLKHLAERRTDIFGSGDRETTIGHKIDEDVGDDNQASTGAGNSSIIWDGHTSTLGAVTRAAKAQVAQAHAYPIQETSTQPSNAKRPRQA